jgi:hypothetical protein
MSMYVNCHILPVVNVKIELKWKNTQQWPIILDKISNKNMIFRKNETTGNLGQISEICPK